MDKDVFQERAFFYSKKTTSINGAGVPIVISYLQINQVTLAYYLYIIHDLRLEITSMPQLFDVNSYFSG